MEKILQTSIVLIFEKYSLYLIAEKNNLHVCLCMYMNETIMDN